MRPVLIIIACLLFSCNEVAREQGSVSKDTTNQQINPKTSSIDTLSNASMGLIPWVVISKTKRRREIKT